MKTLKPILRLCFFINILLIAYGSNPVLAQKNDSVDKVTKFQEFNDKNGGDWNVRWSGKTNSPRMLYGGKSKKYNGAPHAVARQFIQENKRLLLEEKSIENLHHIKTLDDSDYTIVFLQQRYKNLNVEAALYKVAVTEDNKVEHLAGTFYADIDLLNVPTIDESYAIEIVLEDLGLSDSDVLTSELVVLREFIK